MRKLFASVAFLAFAGVASAQDFQFHPAVGVGYANFEEFDASALFASAKVASVLFPSLKNLGATAVVEVSRNDGFQYAIYARGEMQVAGNFYAAVDTKVNGDERDPRAVVGYQAGAASFEFYGQVDGSRLFGAAFHYRVR